MEEWRLTSLSSAASWLGRCLSVEANPMHVGPLLNLTAGMSSSSFLLQAEEAAAEGPLTTAAGLTCNVQCISQSGSVLSRSFTLPPRVCKALLEHVSLARSPVALSEAPSRSALSYMTLSYALAHHQAQTACCLTSFHATVMLMT